MANQELEITKRVTRVIKSGDKLIRDVRHDVGQIITAGIGVKEIISDFINDCDTWSLVDPLCSPCLGTLLRRDESLEKDLKKWNSSTNFWRRRASFLPYLNLALKTNYREEYNTRILDAVTPHLSDDEFFVAKAVGWVLRELSKRSPDLVREFIDENREKMTKLAIREGSKKL